MTAYANTGDPIGVDESIEIVGFIHATSVTADVTGSPDLRAPAGDPSRYLTRLFRQRDIAVWCGKREDRS